MTPGLSLYSNPSSWCGTGGPDWFWNTVTDAAAVAMLGMLWWIVSRTQPDSTPAHRSKPSLVAAALVLVALSIHTLVKGRVDWQLIFFGGLIASALVLEIVHRRHTAALAGETAPTRWQVADRILVWTAPKLTIVAGAVTIVVFVSAFLFGPSCPGPN